MESSSSSSSLVFSTSSQQRATPLKKHDKRCWNCDRINKKVILCANCCFAEYCRRSCKKKNAITHRRGECGRFKEIKPRLKELDSCIAEFGRTLYSFKNSDVEISDNRLNEISNSLRSHVKKIKKVIKEMKQLPLPNVQSNSFKLIKILPEDTTPLQNPEEGILESKLISNKAALALILAAATDVLKSLRTYSHEFYLKINQASPREMKKYDEDNIYEEIVTNEFTSIRFD